MGCCVSTQQHRRSAAPGSNDSKCSNTAAPPEEEMVKEVLSETPTQKPKTEEKVRKKGPGLGSEPAKLKILEEDHKDDGKTTLSVATEVDVSVSESYGESVSTGTEWRDDGEVPQRVTGSPRKIRRRAAWTGQGERMAQRKSPARRPEPESPPVRVRSVPDRTRRAAATDGQRLRPRSSSPARRSADGSCGAARTGLGQSPSARKTGNSPCRIHVDPKKKTRKVVEQTNKEPTPPTSNESLENPLVSLECFIFL